MQQVSIEDEKRQAHRGTAAWWNFASRGGASCDACSIGIDSSDGYRLTDLGSGVVYVCGTPPKGVSGGLFCESCFDEKHSTRHAVGSHSWGNLMFPFDSCSICDANREHIRTQLEYCSISLESEPDDTPQNQVGDDQSDLGIEELMDTVRTGTKDEIKASLNRVSDITVRGKNEYGVLETAALHNPDMVPLLLEFGADPRGGFSLHLAEVPESVKALIDAGADLNGYWSADEKFTPFLGAARSGSLEKLKILVEAGSDLNALSLHGEGALVLAAKWSDDPSVISYLIEHGLDPNKKTSQYAGYGTPLEEALRRPRRVDYSNYLRGKANPSIVLALLKGGAIPDGWNSFNLVRGKEHWENPDAVFGRHSEEAKEVYRILEAATPTS
jgi:ankyrin repeat protein